MQRMRGADPAGRNRRPAPPSETGGRRLGKNRMAVASAVARLFFPHCQSLGIAPDDTVSPAALRYLENQKSRIHYDQYRREGLPITSSHIESTIKQINRRVKGTE